MNNHKTSAELERETEEERARLRASAEELQDRISVGALVDEALDRFQKGGEQGGAFARNLGRSVRDNPVPVAMVGIGLAWLMSGGQRRSLDPRHGWDRARNYFGSDDPYADDYDDGPGWGEQARARAGSAADSVSGAAGEAGRRAGETAEEYRRRMHDARMRAGAAAGDMRRRAGEAADEYRRRIGETAGRARESARRTGASIAESGEHAYWQAREYGNRAGDSAQRFAEENPLVLGGLALALGAALGGLLPNSRAENRLMGSTAERMRSEAARTARQEGERARHVAETALEEGRRAAGEALDEAAGEGARLMERTEARFREAGERVERAAEDEAERQNLGGSVKSHAPD
ncbi:MAG TPA: DUF3618 domain-containing protein [Thermohalobaculum sp.]|nr:DUF3618 domain-containing protein [Thermohalobaculum sp.]